MRKVYRRVSYLNVEYTFLKHGSSDVCDLQRTAQNCVGDSSDSTAVMKWILDALSRIPAELVEA